MKLLMITPSYLPAVRYGGTIFSVHALAKALTALGVEVDVITTNVDGDEESNVVVNEWVNVDGVHVRYFRSKGMFRRFYYSKGMRLFLNAHAEDYDLMHVQAAFLWPNSYVSRIAKQKNIPWVWSPRGMLVKNLFNQKSAWFKWPWWWFEGRRLVRHASLIHCTSEVELRDLSELSQHSHSVIVANGVDAPIAVETHREEGLILYIGRISWKKRLDVLIKVFAEIKKKHPVARLLIAGNDEEGLVPELKQLIKVEGVEDEVEIREAVNREERDELMRKASIFTLISEQENFGNVALEALICECPVVITNSCGAHEVILEAKGGYSVNKSADNIEEAILLLLDNPAEAKKMGNAGANYISANYGWAQKAAELRLEYQRLIEQKVI